MRKSHTSLPPPASSAVGSDRGAAQYFHGRKKILRDFSNLLWRTTQNKGGTTFLIQGAPGAGKSALLFECEKLAQENGWDTLEIVPPALWDPAELRRRLGSAKIPESTEVSGGINFLSFLNLKLAGKRVRLTTEDMLKRGEKPLLLKLDEAQTLGTTNKPPSEFASTATNVLNAIHNGALNRSVILLAAGLGTTVEALESLGISRFNKKCLVELGALDKEAECAVIQDWLKKEGGAKGEPTAWIDAIARETHGWPHHILSYVEPAVDQLDADNGVMTTEGLKTVLDAGRELRSEYYERRAHNFDEEQRHCFARPLAHVALGESTTRSAIMESLEQDYSPDEAEKLFRRALRRGILDMRRGRYAVPIPSMHDWLVSNYAQIKSLHGLEANPDGTSKRIKIRP